jgi:hypothetical protein
VLIWGSSSSTKLIHPDRDRSRMEPATLGGSSSSGARFPTTIGVS